MSRCGTWMCTGARPVLKLGKASRKTGPSMDALESGRHSGHCRAQLYAIAVSIPRLTLLVERELRLALLKMIRCAVPFRLLQALMLAVVLRKVDRRSRWIF